MSRELDRKREKLIQKQQELDDLKRLIQLLDEVEELTKDMSVENIVDISPRVSALSSEADRIIRKHKDMLPNDLKQLSEGYQKTFAVFTEIYQIEVDLKRDVNRLLRIEMRKQARAEREAAAQAAQVTLCDVCKKKPARIYANGKAYCKADARAEGIILKGKIV